MAAASLARYSESQPLKITLIESADIPTVGVGEATVPNIVEYNRQLGLDEIELIKATKATFKLGIRFIDWSKEGESFFHPFADYGVDFQNVGFHHYIRRLQQEGVDVAINDFCFAEALANKGLFAQPATPPVSPVADYAYAYHFDAALYARFLRDFSVQKGVSHISGHVAKVNLDGRKHIADVQLKSGEIIAGDLFIDCTGFDGLLIEQALQTGYEDWSQWLWCDTAVAVQSASTEPPLPFTRSIAREAGWQWEIPLQHRTGNGYIFSSKYIQADEATEKLLSTLKNEPLTAPRTLQFLPGRRKKIWNKNCFALGLASGFLEPLESTSISLIQTAIAKLLTFFPDMTFNQHDIDEVNRLHNEEVERIRDFLILHYVLNQREQGEFWHDYRHLAMPESLQHKVEVFKSRGHLVQYAHESFNASSWLAMYNGFYIRAARYDHRADVPSQQTLLAHMARIQQFIAQLSDGALSHQNFIKKHCQSGG
ncbi:tryptophan 7-halogenase [Alteromonas pelagimontana]|uniref:Tryptophan 7-halogenase n=2 Tax=Alteromonas pelagimontana TaxID=1858656 RepID=A0A6M4ML16_9ALTE|nr:tryptophan 7-halogenase [Alteromonas pelagimontana]